MRKTLIILGALLTLALLFVGACAVAPAPAPEPVPEPTPTPRPKPDITLPAGKGAFYGKVMWGDKPVADSKVIANTENPIVILLSGEYKEFTTNTDTDGNYVLIVEPEEYYIGCTLFGSNYVTYETYMGFPSHTYEATSGEFTLVDLEANDWSIELIPLESEPTLKTNTPTLTWKPYNWAKYDGKVGHYEVIIGIIEDGYRVVLKDEANQESYLVANPLKPGEYRWEVRAFSNSGKEIAGSIGMREFYIPSSVVAPRPSSPEPSMQTQIIVAMPGIDTITDLDGKKLGMGRTQFQYAEVALGTYHIECTTVAIPSQDLWLALEQGVVDAIIIANHPSSDLQTMIDSLGARILPWSDQAIQALIDRFPEVAATVLPANTYSGQDSDILGYTTYQ